MIATNSIADGVLNCFAAGSYDFFEIMLCGDEALTQIVAVRFLVGRHAIHRCVQDG